MMHISKHTKQDIALIHIVKDACHANIQETKLVDSGPDRES